VLAKGGHLIRGDEVIDTLVFPAGPSRRTEAVSIGSARIDTKNTHGTGCSVSAAFATLAARGQSCEAALRMVKNWMTDALTGADELEVGSGHGPIHHFAQLWSRSS